MDEIVYKLPKAVELSQHHKERAECGAYIAVMLSGFKYYVPITKDMKRKFGIIERKGKLIFQNWKDENILFDLTRDIIDCSYLQVRDTVCGGIEQSLDQELKEGFSKLFEKFLHKKVQDAVNLRIEEKIK